MSKIIGIDLGTCGTAAAALVCGEPVMIPSSDGTFVDGKAWPSIVAFTKQGELMIGEAARRHAVMDSERTVVAVKRQIGTDYRVVISKEEKRRRFFGAEYKEYKKYEYSPEQISAFILLKVKQDSEIFLGERVEKAVITVPACFNHNQRQSTKDAAKMAGLEIVRIISESTASALAYAMNRVETKLKVMVFELGGGSFGVTIIDIQRPGGEEPLVLEVLSTDGIAQLGGLDIDNSIIEYLAEQSYAEPKRRQAKEEALEGRSTLGRYMREVAEKAKIELSTAMEAQIHLPAKWGDDHTSRYLTLSRAKLEELALPIIERCKLPMEKALRDAQLSSKAELDKIILVGGPTRMPLVRKYVEDYVGKVAERGIDPLTCAAVGAAIQGGVIAGEMHDVLMLDVIPLSLGVETLGGIFTRMISRTTPIPAKRSHVFTTTRDSQTSVTVSVLQGERSMASDNVSLGEITLKGIQLAKQGVPQIEVSFDIDANGILSVSARDLSTGNKQDISFTAPHRYSERELERLARETQEAYATHQSLA